MYIYGGNFSKGRLEALLIDPSYSRSSTGKKIQLLLVVEDITIKLTLKNVVKKMCLYKYTEVCGEYATKTDTI